MSDASSNGQPYSEGALVYLWGSKDTINQVATTLGVDPGALASGIAREFTRQLDLRVYAPRVAEGRFDTWGNTSESLKSEYDKTLAQYNADPTAFNGKNWVSSGYNPMITDLGPGAIRLFTALQELNKYLNDHKEDGKDPLGLDKYANNYQQFAADLASYTSDLTPIIAGLVAKDAQDYFTTGFGTQFFAQGG